MMQKVEKVKIFFDQPNNYLTQNVIIKLRKKILAEIVGEIENKELLDIGCGNGEITIDFVSKNKMTFVDISENMLALLKERIIPKEIENVKFVNNSIENLVLMQKFDFVFCIRFSYSK